MNNFSAPPAVRDGSSASGAPASPCAAPGAAAVSPSGGPGEAAGCCAAAGTAAARRTAHAAAHQEIAPTTFDRLLLTTRTSFPPASAGKGADGTLLFQARQAPRSLRQSQRQV